MFTILILFAIISSKYCWPAGKTVITSAPETTTLTFVERYLKIESHFRENFVNKEKDDKCNVNRLIHLFVLERMEKEDMIKEIKKKIEAKDKEIKEKIEAKDKEIKEKIEAKDEEIKEKIKAKDKEIEAKDKVIKDKDEKIKHMELDVLKQKLPVVICDEIDRFFFLHRRNVELTKHEEMEIENLNDTNKKKIKHMEKVCEHAITELSTYPIIQQLNEEMDLADYKYLNKLSRAERIKNICQAITWLKFHRNAEIHELLMKDGEIEKIKIFPSSMEVWNEGVAAFTNGHNTRVKSNIEVKFESRIISNLLRESILSSLAGRMKDLKKLRSITFAPIYYFGFAFGVFPYKYNDDLLYPGTKAKGDAFTRSKLGTCICYLFVAIHAYSAGFCTYETYSVIRQNGSCFKEVCSMNVCRNVCGHLTLIWMNYFANCVSTFTVLCLRRKNTIRCVNAVNDLLKTGIYEYEFGISHWIVVFFMSVQVTSFSLHWRNSVFSPQFLYTYASLHLTQCLPIVTENLISVILRIIEQCYGNVNRKIEEMCDKRYFLTNRRNDDYASLFYLRTYHWAVTDAAELVSDSFGLDFMVVGVCSTIRFMYFLFLTLQYTSQQSVINSDGGLVMPSYDVVVFCISVVGKFVYLCARCDRVVSEANKVIANLYTLQNKYRMECDEEGENEVSEFLDQVKCRNIYFKAFDFFRLDLRLICKVFGLTLTYFIVLMQFQASHAN